MAEFAAGTERNIELAIPLRLALPRCPGLSRLIKHGDFVDAAIHGAAFDAHDVIHSNARVGCGGCHIRGTRLGWVVRRELITRRLINKKEDGGCVALGIQSRPKGRTGNTAATTGCASATGSNCSTSGLAHPGLYLRTRYYRPSKGVIRDRDLCRSAAITCQQNIGAIPKACEETHVAAIRADAEITRHRHTVQRHARRCDFDVRRPFDFNESIAAGNQIRAVR